MIYVSGQERTTPLLTGQLLDDDGVAVSTSDVTSVKFTLYDKSTAARTVINNRNAQEVLVGAGSSTGEFAVDVNGRFSFVFVAADMVLLDQALDSERHYFEFEVGYEDAQARSRVAVILGEMLVKNRRKVT